MIDTRVGNVQTVAPARGRDFIVYDRDSSGHHGELTLEITGTKGTGVANFSFQMGTSVYSVNFRRQNKTEELICI